MFHGYIMLLGAMSVLTPFSIDMYLPPFQKVAGDFHVKSAIISLTLSSYFIGLSLGQVFYEPGRIAVRLNLL